MDKRKSYREIKKEMGDRHYEKYVKPIEDGLLRIKDRSKKLLDSPQAALQDPLSIEISAFMERLESLKNKLELSMRNLLFAHAGGAILTINLLPNIIDNKEMLSLATNALSGFAWGLVLLLISVFCVFVSDWPSLLREWLRIMGINNWKIVNYDLSGLTIFVAAISALASLYLFVSAILTTTIGISNLS